MPPPIFDLDAFRQRQPAPDMATWFEVKLGTTKDEDGNEVDEIVRIPPLRLWSARAMDLLSQGQTGPAMRVAVGDDQAAVFERYDLTMGEYEALFDDLGRWSGFQMGRLSSPRPGPGPTLR